MYHSRQISCIQPIYRNDNCTALLSHCVTLYGNYTSLQRLTSVDLTDKVKVGMINYKRAPLGYERRTTCFYLSIISKFQCRITVLITSKSTDFCCCFCKSRSAQWRRHFFLEHYSFAVEMSVVTTWVKARTNPLWNANLDTAYTLSDTLLGELFSIVIAQIIVETWGPRSTWPCLEQPSFSLLMVTWSDLKTKAEKKASLKSTGFFFPFFFQIYFEHRYFGKVI